MHHLIKARTGLFPHPARGGLLAAIACVAALGLAGCGSAPKTAFDLSAARGGGGRAGGGGQVLVAEPTGLQAFESERIAVKDAAGAVSVLPDGQWADRLPRLLQARLIQSIENSGRARPARPGDGVTPDGQLNTDIRAFQLEAAQGEVRVELYARLLDARSGRVVRSRLFAGRAPVGGSGVGAVAQALDGVSARLMAEISRWVGSGPAPAAPPETALRSGAT